MNRSAFPKQKLSLDSTITPWGLKHWIPRQVFFECIRIIRSIVNNAKLTNVDYLLTISVNLEDFEKVHEVTQNYETREI